MAATTTRDLRATFMYSHALTWAEGGTWDRYDGEPEDYALWAAEQEDAGDWPSSWSHPDAYTYWREQITPHV